MRGALALRLTLALGATLFLLVMLFALALDALATQSERDLREGRYAYILAELKQRVEAPLSLGLQVESLDYLQRLLEREAAGDPDILSIDLFNSSGDQLFTTDADDIRSAVPSSWLQDTQNLPHPNRKQREGRKLIGWQKSAMAGSSRSLSTTTSVSWWEGSHYATRLLTWANLCWIQLPSVYSQSPLWPHSLRSRFLVAESPAGTANGSLDRCGEGTPQGPEALVPPGPLDRDGLRLLEALQEAERRCAAATAEVEQIDGRS